MLKFSGPVVWRLGTRATFRKYSNPSSSMFKLEGPDSTKGISDNVKLTMAGDRETSGLVAAAFASLNAPEGTLKKPSPKSAKPSKVQQLDAQIMKADNVDSLLVVAENPIVSRRHALKMVSVLSEWSNDNKVKLSDFERDPRFLKLCRILARTPTAQAMSSLTMAEDLSTVLGITGDDEAARLITNLSLSQMIKVMKVLSQKGRRSTPLLRALAHGISKQPERVDLKRAADLMFCMCALSFPDPVLMDRLCSDAEQCLATYEGSGAAVTSLATSLARLRWRRPATLAALAQWWQPRAPRPADAAALLAALAALDCVPPEAEYVLELAMSLREEDMSRAAQWLELVWALLLLGRASPGQLASCLRPRLLEQLQLHGEIPIPLRRKLLLLAAAAQCEARGGAARGGAARGGAAPELPPGVAAGPPLRYSKEKALYVAAILDTFRSLVSADTFLKRDCNSGMGFLYDAEFAVDSKCNPVPLEKAANDKSVHRVAVLGLDYHDMTRATPRALGPARLYARLLRAQGFKVLTIPYTEFNPKDKLITRVQYIQQRLQSLISEQQAAS